MKIGILTFHSQLNYGGVLQCWALQNALARILSDERGVMSDERDEVVVVDRWLDPRNKQLLGGYPWFGFKEWVGFVLRGIMGCGQFGQFIRHRRTVKFVKSLGLTAYHFYDWKDAPKDLGIDCIVVGSDQVWHGGDWAWPTPDPYLLHGAPRMKAIAYAASFGLRELPAQYDYAGGFRNFAAISVREAEGVGLVGGTGYPHVVRHVVDPTLLLEKEEWFKMARPAPKHARLVCYFLSQDLSQVVPIVEDWARLHGWSVDIVCSGFYKKFPKSFRDVLRRFHSCVVRSPVNVHTDFGPAEFVKAFAGADACITDSFHAVMFSSIYNLNVRFLRPTSEDRSAMFARIEEFAHSSICGAFMENGIPAALNSLLEGKRTQFNDSVISARRSESIAWLRDNLK